MSTKILNEIEQGLKELIRETDEKFDKFLGIRTPKPNLNEIGEANQKQYPFKLLQATPFYIYQFFTEDNDDYRVEMDKNEKVDVENADHNEWHAGFHVDGRDIDDAINKGRMFKVMATVVAILQDFTQRQNPDMVLIEPVKADEDYEDDERRAKLYNEYIKKNLPSGYSMEYNPDIIFIIKNGYDPYPEYTDENVVKKNILKRLNENTEYNFTEEDLDNCWQYSKSYLVDILNGEYDLNTAREDLQSLIGSKYDKRTANFINEDVLNETTYRVYHGTNQEFNNFDLKKATQGIIWFTDSIDSIKSGEHGGNGNKYIMTRDIVLNNPAGWDEYEKYGLGQLRGMGYDGVILPHGNEYNDFIVFNTKSIKKPKNELNEGKSDNSLKQILNSDAAYAILDSSDANGNTWCAGGCAILAYALNIVHGYPVFVIYNSTDGQVEHFGVKTPNNIYIDCDGEQRDWLRNFRSKEFYLHPEKKLQILPYTKDLNISNIVVDMNASQELASLIKGDNSNNNGINNLNEGTDYYEKKFPNEFAELNALDDKQLEAKKDEIYEEYKRVMRWENNQAKEDLLMNKIGMAQQILDDRKKNKYDTTYQKFIGRPFLGSTINSIILPGMSEDGEWKTFRIYLDDEGEFEYYTGSSPEFKYYKYLGKDDSIYLTQYLDRPVPPNEAILTQKELDLLNLIIRFNNTSHDKKPYPRNATVKDNAASVPQKPEIDEADLQWMVGQGGNEYRISEVRISNNIKADSYSGGYIYIYIEVEDLRFKSPWTNKNYSYSVSYNAFFKPEKEDFKVRIGIEKEEEVKYMYEEVYEPIMKGIKQVNPQTKIFNKISAL